VLSIRTERRRSSSETTPKFLSEPVAAAFPRALAMSGLVPLQARQSVPVVNPLRQALEPSSDASISLRNSASTTNPDPALVKLFAPRLRVPADHAWLNIGADLPVPSTEDAADTLERLPPVTRELPRFRSIHELQEPEPRFAAPPSAQLADSTRDVSALASFGMDPIVQRERIAVPLERVQQMQRTSAGHMHEDAGSPSKLFEQPQEAPPFAPPPR